LFAVVNVARHLGLDSEVALRRAARKFQDRFTAVERMATADGLTLGNGLDAEALDAFWERAKANPS